MKRSFVFLALAAVASAWTNTPKQVHHQRGIQQRGIKHANDNDNSHSQNRRKLLKQSLPTILVAPWLQPFVVQPQPAMAAQSPSPTDVFAGKLSADEAKKRFQMARKDLAYLLENNAEISQGGGDAVRNYLGTQGVTSKMYGIQKVLKILQQEADDIVEYTETMDEFNAYYYQAEGAAYQSLFAEHSSAKSTPKSLLETAQKDIVQMVRYMDQLAAQLNL